MTDPRALGPQSPEASDGPLVCAHCKELLASRVSYCPFCGSKVAAEPPAITPSAPEAPEKPQVPPPPPPRTQTPPPPPPTAPTPPSSIAETIQRPAWKSTVFPVPARSLMWALGAVAIGLFVIIAYATSSRPKGSLVVHVQTASGATVTAGRVFVNDAPAGNPDERLSVAPGTLSVRYETPGWSSQAATVFVPNGGDARATVIARPLPARLALTSKPSGASVASDGRSLGRTPLNVELPAQSRHLVLSMEGYERRTLEVNLVAGQTATYFVDLTPIPAPAPAPAPAPIAPQFRPAPFERGVLSTTALLYASPSRSATTTPIPRDTEVSVLAQVLTEESWYQVRIGSHQGFLPADGVLTSWNDWARQNTVSGTLDEVTPGLRALVNGAAYTLAGVKSPDSGFGASLSHMRDALARTLRGQQVTCVPQTLTKYQCKTPTGNDLGEFYVLNGAAVLGDGAPSYYFESQQKARLSHKGIWAE